MADHSKISWCDATWNPDSGCSHVSEGCRNCYAEELSLRRGWSAKPWTAPNAAENVVLHENRIDQPLRWKTPRRVFVNSMSDVFHEQIPDEFVDRMFVVMALTPHHTYQILTKRPERMLRYINRVLADPETVHQLAWEAQPGYALWEMRPWPLPNVWLGVSVEDQRAADERIPYLVITPAVVRFLSCEPLLGPIYLQARLGLPARSIPCSCPCHHSFGAMMHVIACCDDGIVRMRGVPSSIDWIIVGGESGPHFRPMDPAWARSIRDQCAKAHVAFFSKQGAARYPQTDATLDGLTYHDFPQVPNGR